MQNSTAPLQGFRLAIARPPVNLNTLSVPTAISVSCFRHAWCDAPRRPGCSSGRLSPRSPTRSDRIKFSIKDYLDRNPTTGLLIARDDTILYEHYQYARTDRDRFLSQSMAKTITAMLIGIAVSEGKIRSIDDPVSAYVPGLADGGIRKDLDPGLAAYVVRCGLYGKLRWQ